MQRLLAPSRIANCFSMMASISECSSCATLLKRLIRACIKCLSVMKSLKSCSIDVRPCNCTYASMNVPGPSDKSFNSVKIWLIGTSRNTCLQNVPRTCTNTKKEQMQIDALTEWIGRVQVTCNAAASCQYMMSPPGPLHSQPNQRSMCKSAGFKTQASRSGAMIVRERTLKGSPRPQSGNQHPIRTLLALSYRHTPSLPIDSYVRPGHLKGMLFTYKLLLGRKLLPRNAI